MMFGTRKDRPLEGQILDGEELGVVKILMKIRTKSPTRFSHRGLRDRFTKLSKQERLGNSNEISCPIYGLRRPTIDLSWYPSITCSRTTDTSYQRSPDSTLSALDRPLLCTLLFHLYFLSVGVLGSSTVQAPTILPLDDDAIENGKQISLSRQNLLPPFVFSEGKESNAIKKLCKT
ncbi:unnamed protein product [Dovyalis caffra]|uniref:Uncharacterized protein n=1 Tax=Dovyalis caffra TaxID=77055 RepID=A0AAV1SAK2_9ROSI|nr:unnamed protein product [Dovyalis caffra]